MLAADDLNPSPCHCKAFTVGHFSNIVVSVMEILVMPFLIILFSLCLKRWVA